METVTAENITDEQIRELFAASCECRPLNICRSAHSHDCDHDTCEDCRVALGGTADSQAARARCAGAWNARRGMEAR